MKKSFLFKSKSQVCQNWQLTPNTHSNTIFGRCHLGGAGTSPLKFRKGTILEKHHNLSNHKCEKVDRKVQVYITSMRTFLRIGTRK